jgi:hypothetical protein
MTETEQPEAAVVTTDGRPTPMVLSVARRLRDSLASGMPLTASELPRTIELSSATDAQRACLTFWGNAVIVAADGATPGEHQWEVRWQDPVVTSEAEPQDAFEVEVRALLAGRELTWREAVEDFWNRTHAMPGMPTGLGVYCFDEDATVQHGDLTRDGYQLLGTAGALTRLFGARTLFLEELEREELALDGPLSGASALAGANLKVVCGEL